jgi:hypothetical protein
MIRRLKRNRTTFNAMCLATSWGGKPSDLDVGTLAGLTGPILSMTQDDALPLPTGTDSETRPQGEN